VTFKKAERTQARLKIALTGPSGSGKTFSALIIAAGIGKKIAVVDTENGSASLYADMDKGPLAGISFDTLEIVPPYTIGKYLEAIDAAEKAGYDVLVVDSISHAWAGEGGLLDKKTALDARGGNSYTNWATITPEQERFKARILQADMHIICTMRSKQDYVLELNEKGKQAPRKVGLAPIQRDGMEYEFTTVLDIAMDHNAAASKDRTGLFDGQIFKPTKETGVKIMKWLKAGKPVAVSAPLAATPKPETAAAKPLARVPDEFDPKALAPEGAAGDDFMDEAEAGPEPKGACTLKQLERFGKAKAALAKKGVDEQKLWEWVIKFTAKEFKRAVIETSDFTTAELDAVITYLGAWDKNIDEQRAAKAAKEKARDKK
jgi:hypothetical protein